LHEATDAELIRRSRRSAEAFRALYDRHAERVHRFLARRTGDGQAALELTAETFAAAWLSRARFEDRAGGSAAPWLYGIARNVLGAKELVTIDERIAGGCIGRDREGRCWDCYLGDKAVERETSSPTSSASTRPSPVAASTGPVSIGG
jgi:hypothetical protein